MLHFLQYTFNAIIFDIFISLYIQPQSDDFFVQNLHFENWDGYKFIRNRWKIFFSMWLQLFPINANMIDVQISLPIIHSYFPFERKKFPAKLQFRIDFKFIRHFFCLNASRIFSDDLWLFCIANKKINTRISDKRRCE